MKREIDLGFMIGCEEVNREEDHGLEEYEGLIGVGEGCSKDVRPDI